MAGLTRRLQFLFRFQCGLLHLQLRRVSSSCISRHDIVAFTVYFFFFDFLNFFSIPVSLFSPVLIALLLRNFSLRYLHYHQSPPSGSFTKFPSSLLQSLLDLPRFSPRNIQFVDNGPEHLCHWGNFPPALDSADMQRSGNPPRRRSAFEIRRG